MILSRSRRLTVRMGEYEIYQFGCEVSMAHHDLGYTDDEWAALGEPDRFEARGKLTGLILDELVVQLEDEIEDAAALTKDHKSYLHKLVRPEEPPPKPATTRRRRAHRTTSS